MRKGLGALVGFAGSALVSSGLFVQNPAYSDEIGSSRGVLENVWSMVVRKCNSYLDRDTLLRPCDMVLTAEIEGVELSLFANNHVVYKNTISNQGIYSTVAPDMRGLAIRVGFGGFCDYVSVSIVHKDQNFDDSKIPDTVKSLPNDSNERDCNKRIKKGDSYDIVKTRAFHRFALEAAEKIIGANTKSIIEPYNP